CAALSVAIEFVQLYFPPRTVSLNDIAVESLGGLVGALTWLAVGQRLTEWLRGLSTITGVEGLAGRFMPAYLFLLLVVQLMPFDLAVRPEGVAVKYHEGKIWLLPFQHVVQGGGETVVKLFTNMACFLPLGFLKVLVRRRKPKTRRSWAWVILFGLGVTSVIEIIKI